MSSVPLDGLHLLWPHLPVVGVSTAFAEALLASVWSSCVLAAAASLALRALPGMSAAARSLLWVTVLLVALALPVLPALVHLWHPAAAYGAGSAVAHRGLILSQRWSLLLVAVSALVSGWRAAMLAASALRLRRLARRAHPVVAGDSVQRILAEAARSAELCVSADVQRPSVAGFVRPRILLPAGLMEAISTDELEQIVLHELAHLARCDDWTNLLQKAALAVFPLNPVLVWLDRRLCLERELACDDAVLRRTGARKAYAACLVSLAERSTLLGRGLSLALGAWDRESELLRRVRRILAQPGRVMGPLQMRVATTIIAAGVASGAVVLAHAPQLVTFAGPGTAVKAEPVVAAACRRPAGPLDVVAPAGSRAIGAEEVSSITSGSPRAVLTVDHVAAPADAIARQISISKPRRVSSNRAGVRTVALTPGQWMSLLVTWNAADRQSIPSHSTMQRELQGRQGAQPTPAVNLEFQPTFAAVPTPDGWLIVQL